MNIGKESLVSILIILNAMRPKCFSVVGNIILYVPTMRIVITEGTQFDDRYEELSRQPIDTAPEVTVGELLDEVKKLPFQMLNAPYSKNLIDHLYLMHSETRERLDESRSLTELGISDGTILRLMSGVR